MTEPESAAPPLTLRLFGPFEARVNGAPLPRLRSHKNQWLLALLVLRQGREVERAWLAGLLWPDAPESQAMVSLRSSLSDLRRALGAEAARLRSPTVHTLLLDLSGAEVDLMAFDQGVARGDAASLEQAISLYRGPLLEGCAEEWAFEERQAREQAYLGALERLAALAVEQGNPQAEQYLRRAVAVDPLRESVLRALMQTLAAAGSYTAAAQVYQELRRLLHQELNAEPDPETQALFQQLRAEARRLAALGEGVKGRLGERMKERTSERPEAPVVSPEHLFTPSPPHPFTPSPPLPSGTVTFLLTDIEGSTKLWLDHPEAMRQALARHDALAAAIIPRHEGFLLKRRGEGDSLFAVFPRASDAVAAALDLQRALSGVRAFGRSGLQAFGPSGVQVPTKSDPSNPSNPSTPERLNARTPERLNVRIALHTGEAGYPRSGCMREGDYFGLAVNHCARLRAVAHGGQTLLSQATAALVREELPPGAGLRELGAHRLKDLQRSELIFQLTHPELPAEFPPLRSLEAFAHNLPVQLTRFVGREREIAEVKRLLATTHLLTLTGAGGCGKTRLALQAAAEVVDETADGVWLVELGSLADPALVAPTVASTLGVREAGGAEGAGYPPQVGGGRRLIETLADTLRPRSLLLVLDNCEHLLPACAELADRLLRACPHLRILATSREGLGLLGEQTYRVPPLSVPGIQAFKRSGVQDPADPAHPTDPTDLTDPERRNARTPEPLMQYEAVGLFVDRAVLSQPSFALTGTNARAVVEICQRLEGIPLAIELAAARVKALPVEKIAERLDDRFRLLTGGSRTALPRQQTLRALIDWSYDLLTEREQTLLRRLSVFAGGWTLEAAEAVAPLQGSGVRGQGLDRQGSGVRGEGSVPELLTPDPSPLAPEDVLDLLTSLVEKSLVQYEAGNAGGGADDPSGEGAPRYRLLETVRQYARDRLGESGEAEQVRDRHFTFFLQWAEQAEPELHRREQIEWLERLEREHDNLRAALDWCAASGVRGEGSGRHGSGVRGQESVPTVLAPDPSSLTPGAQRLTPDPSPLTPEEMGLRLAGALTWLWLKRNHFAEGRQWLEQALSRGSGAPTRRRVKVLQGLGIIARFCGDQEASRAALEESVVLARDAGDRSATVYSLIQLGVQASWQNDFARAKRLGEESLALAREVGDPWLLSHPLHLLGLVASHQGESREAIRLFEESLCLTRGVGDKFHMAMTMGFLAIQLGVEGQRERARQLHLEEIALGQELKDKRMAAWGLEALSWVESGGGQTGCSHAAWVRAARLMGAAEGLFAPSPLLLPPARRSIHDQTMAATRAALGEAAFATAWAEGRAMSMEQVIHSAREADGRTA